MKGIIIRRMIIKRQFRSPKILEYQELTSVLCQNIADLIQETK